MVLGPEELSARGILSKTSPPVSHLVRWCPYFEGWGFVLLSVSALLILSFGLQVVAIRGNVRKFCSWKNVSPLSCAALSHSIVE